MYYVYIHKYIYHTHTHTFLCESSFNDVSFTRLYVSLGKAIAFLLFAAAFLYLHSAWKIVGTQLMLVECIGE